MENIKHYYTVNFPYVINERVDKYTIILFYNIKANLRKKLLFDKKRFDKINETSIIR